MGKRGREGAQGVAAFLMGPPPFGLLTLVLGHLAPFPTSLWLKALAQLLAKGAFPPFEVLAPHFLKGAFPPP